MIYANRYFDIKFIWIIDGRRYMWLTDPKNGESVFIWEWASTSDRYPW